MTYDEFIKKLVEIKDMFDWRLTPFSKKIRGYRKGSKYLYHCCCCPITAVEWVESGLPSPHSTNDWRCAAARLSLSFQMSGKIVVSSDNVKGSLRKSILNALGLSDSDPLQSFPF